MNKLAGIIKVCVINGLAILLILLSSNSNPEPKPTFTMGFWNDPNEEITLKFAYLLYRELFSRIGYDFKIKVVPTARVGYLVEESELDGEPGRIIGYAKRHPKIVRVKEPILEISIAGFIIKNNIELNAWADLQDTELVIGYVLGSNIVEEALKNIVPPSRVTTSKQVDDGLTKLVLGRTDVFIHPQLLVEPFLREPAFADKNILVTGILHRDFAYPYLSPKRADMSDLIAKTLSQMHRDGTTQRILDQTINEFRPSYSSVLPPTSSKTAKH